MENPLVCFCSINHEKWVPKCPLHCLLKISSLYQNAVRLLGRKHEESCILRTMQHSIMSSVGILRLVRIFQQATVDGASRRGAAEGEAGHMRPGCASGMPAARPSLPKRGAAVSSADTDACRLSLGADLRGPRRDRGTVRLGRVELPLPRSHREERCPPCLSLLGVSRKFATYHVGSSVLWRRPLSRSLLWETHSGVWKHEQQHE